MKSGILSRIINALARHGSVSFVASIGGREITVGVSADPREAVSAKRRPGAWGGWGASPDEMAAKAAEGVVITRASSDKTVARIIEAVQANPIGLSLEELAERLGVRPRTQLSSTLAALLQSGRLVKVGRLFRDADAQVKRGPKPKPKGGSARALSEAKLSALAKARAALARARELRRS